jgi:hypothetical protein
LNISLGELLNPPANVFAILDSLPQVNNISWSPPAGEYELLYDDGTQEDFSVWAFQGNLNAVKFSPPAYPARLTGCSVNIGSQINYPQGSNPWVPFQLQVFSANGTGGTPGTSLYGPITVTPYQWGWNSFLLPDTLVIPSGSIFIAMIQGGNAPNAAGIAIDETSNQFRSYLRYASGNSPWFPAGGNLMLRADLIGPGGPAFSDLMPFTQTGYKIWRLRQGEEQNTAAWNFLGQSTLPWFYDSSWAVLPCGPYRWAVKATYPGNNVSDASFSNVNGKCWTAPVTLQLTTTCSPSNPDGAQVILRNLLYPDTVYQQISTPTGLIHFNNVWKGNYKLTAIKFGYDTLVTQLPVSAPVNFGVNLLQVRVPPDGLTVNDSSLMAHWNVPHYERSLFSENWSSAGFSANQWIRVPEISNWSVSTSDGNPAPAAFFSSIPNQVGYDQSLVSKWIPGVRSTLLKLRYDIFFDSYGTTTQNQLAVEIWDGSGWNLINSYSNQNGNLPWSAQETDISDYSWSNFRLRFRAFGEDTYDINNWMIDNIDIIASEPAQQQANCILGYYFYLNNSNVGYTNKNAFQVPPALVQYGQSYSACVRALYGSGDSDPDCTTFSAFYLYPVGNPGGIPIENTAWIHWEKPVKQIDTVLVTPGGLTGYHIYRDGLLLDSLTDPDVLEYYDYNLEPGVYQYSIAAKYDLTDYGFPGQFSESLKAGPVHIPITWGRTLPFSEPWNTGSFTFNEWTFSPNPGNWAIDLVTGNPAPVATFSGFPVLTDYDISLISPAFNALPFSCAAIWLDFDIKLIDRNANGSEKLIVEVYYNHEWHKKAEFQNNGQTGWLSNHVDLSVVRGKGFRIRFRLMGLNSYNIQNWLIDNISLRPLCYPAVNLSAQVTGYVVTLSWSPPVCHGGNLLQEGFEDPSFPPADWITITKNPNAHWSHVPASTPVGSHSGNFSAGLNWDYSHQDEWLIAKNVYVDGDLTFWSYAYHGSLHLDHYYVRISLDQGLTWNTLLDLSALPPYPSANGFNAWVTPYIIDLSPYAGETIDIAWHAIDGDGNGLWYPWAIDDCTVGMTDLDDSRTNRGEYDKNKSPDALVGYYLFRRQGVTGDFIQLNSAPVTDTTYQDNISETDNYYYFIRSVFVECENPANSDTVLAEIITSRPSDNKPMVELFPIPADDQLTIRSSGKLKSFTLYTLTGVVVKESNLAGEPAWIIDTSDMASGVYLGRIGFEDGSRSVMVVINH